MLSRICHSYLKYLLLSLIATFGLRCNQVTGEVIKDDRLYNEVAILTSPSQAMLYLNGKKLGLSPQTVLIERQIQTRQLITALPLHKHQFRQEVPLSIGEAPDQLKIFMDYEPVDYDFADEPPNSGPSISGCAEINSNLPTFYFATNEFVLNEEQMINIKSLFCTLSTLEPLPIITITGGADETGHLEYNKTLSVNRALAVKSALIKQGYSENLIKVQGYGATHLINDTMATLSLRENRRATIHIDFDHAD